ncbi:MAG: S1 RNA-binding domain-containing protein [Nanoarchaeota archaeon]|nr:S1 RNA-binding domain-containing protein [Nanoarchaeota archaeon]
MYFHKEGYPEEHEFVLCTVERITPNSVFVTLDDYSNKEALIHISEIAPGRIRNIRDYVKEKHKVVCIVLTSNKERNLIDLSVRRVSLQHKLAVEEWHKQEMIAEKLLDSIARSLKLDGKDVYEKVGKQLIQGYGSLFKAFQEVANLGEKALEKMKIDKKIATQLITSVQDRIKRPEVKIHASLSISSRTPDGIDRIKTVLKGALEVVKSNKQNILLHHVGAPKFNVTVTAADFKSAQRALDSFKEDVEKNGKKLGCECLLVQEK